MNFDFDRQSRQELSTRVINSLEDYYNNTKSRKVSANWDTNEVRNYTRNFSLSRANEARQVIDHVLHGLNKFIVHTPHPGYYGLFNPRPNFASILADQITATFNPQLAAWSHSPFANEIENYIIQEFGKKFGYEDQTIDGTFCTGGAEANLTAIICALNDAFPDFGEKGLQTIQKQATIYCSSESHHSIEKAAKLTGLGSCSVRSIPVNKELKMEHDTLRNQIQHDRNNGYFPLMVIGTAGTTGAGAIDDLISLNSLARQEKMWFHVDAAYGGAAIVSSKYKSCLAGIEKSDSITLDLHKWFSVPMGASLFLTKKKKILHRSFAIHTNYMPEDGDPNQIIDPYLHSVQWSRRFIGLKIYLPLAIHGWEGYEKVIDNQFELGKYFREMLRQNEWEICNSTPLPILCFSKKEFKSNEMDHLVKKINASGKYWMSTYPIKNKSTGRVCLTNYSTGMLEINEFIELLGRTQCERPFFI